MWWKCIFVGCGIYLFGELVGAKTMLILGWLGSILYLFLVCATIKFYCEEYAPHNEAILVPLLRKLGFRYRGRVRKGKYIRGMRMVRNNDTLEICTVMEKEGQEKLRVYIKDYTIELPYPPSEEHYRLLEYID